MKKVTTIFLFCFLLGGCAAQELVLHEDQAIAVSNSFLKAIMQGDYKTAYDKYMSPGLKYGTNFTFVQFQADWEALIEKYGSLEKAVFDAYQPVAGKKVIQLYYKIQHQKVDEIIYHLVLEQNRDGKFTLFLIDIGNEENYPAHIKKPPEKLKKEQDIVITLDETQ